MKITPTSLDGLAVVETPVYADERGWFTESFNERAFHDALRQAGLPAPGPFVQDNHSCSNQGVLRGLHYQLPPHAQGKLVRVVSGAAFDVAVDIRQGSPTFGRWVGIELSAQNRRQVWMPEGFAHGFVALADGTQFLYKTTAYYTREFERSLAWNDASIGIEWPLADALQMSAKDAAASSLTGAVERGEVFFA